APVGVVSFYAHIQVVVWIRQNSLWISHLLAPVLSKCLPLEDMWSALLGCEGGEVIMQEDAYWGMVLHNKVSRRQARQSEVNDLIKRALGTAGVAAIREPVGLNRTDGKRPDGVTLAPWKNGRCVVWDFTCIDSLNAKNFGATMQEPGKPANTAEKGKMSKYQALGDNYEIVPCAIDIRASGTGWLLQTTPQRICEGQLHVSAIPESIPRFDDALGDERDELVATTLG
ncbi:MAG: hypothetical protein AAF493_07200, partial [Pseudomonadota bacterium]